MHLPDADEEKVIFTVDRIINSFTRVSRSIKYGFPAKAENDWYGLSP